MALTPKSFFEEKLSKGLTDDPSRASSIGAIYQFNITGDDGGSWTVDLTKTEGWINAGEAENAECTITMTSEDFVDMITGKLAGPQAFMQGKLKIAGNMALAMKLSNILG
jgi:putative sterol carrier protein